MGYELAVVACAPWHDEAVAGSARMQCAGCEREIAISPNAQKLTDQHEHVMYLCMWCAKFTSPSDVPIPVPGSVERTVERFGETGARWVEEMLSVPLGESLTEERLQQFEEHYGGGE